MAHLASIRIYPIKSLDPVEVQRAVVTASGALLYDREYALLDEAGKYVNGKSCVKIHSIRSAFDLEHGSVKVWSSGGSGELQVRLPEEMRTLEGWLTRHFDFAVRLVRNRAGGFPDDEDAHGPTIVSTETLAEVASWFPGLSVDDVRSRFRTNLEIAGAQPFWEDRLFGAKGEGARFQIGRVAFEGVGPCARCVVPGRDPGSGVPLSEFQKTFSEQRRKTLPAWAKAERFDHFYRLAVNTRLLSTEDGQEISVGDELRW